MPLRYTLQAECPETGARAGLIETDHGVIETPIFMPVGTAGSVKALSPRALTDDIGAQIILGNTYHLHLRPGARCSARWAGCTGSCRGTGPSSPTAAASRCSRSPSCAR